MEVFQMLDFCQLFPGPRWGANSAPPEPVVGFPGAYTSHWIYKPVSY